MKKLLHIVIFSISIFCSQSFAETAEEVRNGLADWEQAIHKIPQRFDAENLKMLAEGLRKLSRRKSTFPAWRGQLYELAQQKMISIPGHAEYFAAEVERLREADLKWKPAQRTTYDRWRTWYLRDTLCHMPSPETVRVLGRYLHDERDTPLSPQGDSRFLPQNAYLASSAFANLGLRVDPPLPDSGIIHWRNDVDEIRAWYAKVKSGEIPFSFKGQAVEYRFKPDGTWDTIPITNPPDDAPEIPEARPAAGLPVTQETKELPIGNAGKAYRPYLLAALAGLLALAAAWFGLRRTKAGT